MTDATPAGPQVRPRARRPPARLRPTRRMSLFSVQHVTLRFGGVTSLNDVSLTLHRGEILSIIGPNGAGKTSLFNCLTGVYTPQEGSILLTLKNGHEISVVGRKPYKVSRLGVARTFQTSRMFGALTTFENVKIGVESKQHTGPIGAILRLAPDPARGARERPEDAGASEVRRADTSGERDLELASLRGPPAPGDRPGTRDEPGGAAARRACRRYEPRREGPAR